MFLDDKEKQLKRLKILKNQEVYHLEECQRLLGVLLWLQF